ncbi:DUF1707 domain-containing protein [Corynebacterium sp. ACRPE]|uniref:DUF1707 SHOCT-like domain-containing protein n=1 Tax=Corynebacterium sp. ACRPE TaxID=2918196 RepID=UPI001EF6D7D6|nr:DUF1707 domain-containing protein [Corynebacterium sp. ACRPE]MCG7467138.1 DUF1707 domain-containing protein [Corynebacterium sp. ACRPE]
MKPLDIRCNHQDRMKAADILGDALSAGQIDLDEFEKRSAECVDATTRAELIEPLADLVEDPEVLLFGQERQIAKAYSGHQESNAIAKVEQAIRQVQPNVDAPRSLAVGLFGGSTVSGGAVARTLTALGVFGGVDVNLAGAALRNRTTTINAVGLFGGTDVYIPEGFRVRVGGFGLFGGHELKVEHGAIHPNDLPVDAPEIIVNCFSLFGGVDVHVGRRYGA